VSSLRRFDDKVWDEFFDFVMPCDELTSDAELDVELRRIKVDVTPAVNRVLDAARAARARERLRAAQKARAGVLAKLGDLIPTTVENVRQNIEELIARLSTPQQAVHFRKLRNASSEQDLLSLYEDMQRLNGLSKDANAGAGPATANSEETTNDEQPGK
jgi:hypothetical protein